MEAWNCYGALSMVIVVDCVVMEVEMGVVIESFFLILQIA
jgi:hypothetical protein